MVNFHTVAEKSVSDFKALAAFLGRASPACRTLTGWKTPIHVIYYGVTYLKKLVETPLDVRLNPCATGPSGILQGSI